MNQILKRQTSRFHYGAKVPAVTITVCIIIQWNWQHRAHKTKKHKTKYNTICAGHYYAQNKANNVNKTWALLQTGMGKEEPNIFFIRKSSYCIVCPSSIDGLWFPLWYLQTCLTSGFFVTLYRFIFVRMLMFSFASGFVLC